MPSLVNGRPSYDYERGPNRMNGTLSDGFDNFNYRDDPYARDDMRREDEDRNRRSARNGGPTFDRFNTDYLDQNSLSDFRSNEPKFELDHLATFAAGSRSGCIHAEDGLRKLRQMENTTGIWTMRCVLIVERNFLVILDNSTQEELERFPVQLVHDPTAIFKNDRREIYNNLILFTIVDDPKKRTSAADMHIFQSCKAPAQEIVDEVQAAQGGQQRVYPAGGGRIPPPPVFPAPEPNGVYDFHGMREFFNQNGPAQGSQFVGQQRSLITRVNSLREKEDLEGGSNEILERDVQLLNHCFDDIEKFVARLQQAAESYKELEKRKKERGAKNKKRQSGGDGMLNARARPPPQTDFVDIFRKFKLSFNLLAKLKAHIHDPNAPELVHFLFTPLSLIFEASRDPYHGNQNLCDHAVAPVLTAEAKQLLLNCLSSKEIELWQQLGKHWTTSRSEWNGEIPAYVPEFYDGWQPAAGVVDELSQRTATIYGPPHLPPMPDTGRSSVYNHSPRPMPFPDEEPSLDRSYQRGFEPNHRGYDLPPRSYEASPRGYEPLGNRSFEPLPNRGFDPPGARPYENNTPRSGMHSALSDYIEQPTPLSDRSQKPEPQRIIEPAALSTPRTREEENNLYYEELKRSGDATIYEVAHDRVGKNPKELTVQKGDVVHVLDNSKNWWKLRNYKREVGFTPYTILKALKTEEDHVPNGIHPFPESSHDNRGNYSRRASPALIDEIQQLDAVLQMDFEPETNKQARFYQGDDPSDSNFSFLGRRESPEPSYSHRGRMSPAPPSYPARREPSPAPRGRMSPAPMERQREISPSRSRHRAPSPPAMPAPNVRRKEPQTYDLDRTADAGRREKDYLQEELHTKIASRQQWPSSRHLAGDAPMRLSLHSSAQEVADWLQMKGFSQTTQNTFAGFMGSDMFTLQLSQLSRFLGHDESIRLDGLLRLQKNTSGYATRSSKELNDILQRRMEHVNNADEERNQNRTQERNQGKNQDMNQNRSNSSSDLGLNLREQLVRQRSQLRSSQVDLELY